MLILWYYFPDIDVSIKFNKLFVVYHVSNNKRIRTYIRLQLPHLIKVGVLKFVCLMPRDGSYMFSVALDAPRQCAVECGNAQ